MAEIKYDNCSPNKVLKQMDMILEELRKQGCRITKQRRLIIDIILNNECSSCKELHWKVIQKDPSVGIATVYRMIKTMEDIGAINRRNLYRVPNNNPKEVMGECFVVLKNKEVIPISADLFTKIIKTGLSMVNGWKDIEIENVLFMNGLPREEMCIYD